MTMSRMRAGVLGCALLALAGCGAKSSASGNTQTLVSNLSEEVPPGVCAAIEGPYAVPDGTSMDYFVTDIDDTDDMDVAIIDDAFGCDFSSGYGVEYDVASIHGGDDLIAAGNYDIVVRCRNVFTSCIFSLSWSATY